MQNNEELKTQNEEQITAPVKVEKSSKVLKSKFLQNLKYDLYGAFILKPWNISLILLLIPGLFLGLFMGYHIDAIHKLPVEYDMTAFYLFILILLGCISMFSGFSFSSKRSIGHAIFGVIISALLITFALLYCIGFFQSGLSNDSITLSIVCVLVSVICNLIGAIMNLFFIDRHIEKE